jgi:hypothetical protein
MPGMKVSVVTTSEIELPSQMFAVVLDDPSESRTVVAMFAWADLRCLLHERDRRVRGEVERRGGVHALGQVRHVPDV